jgi:V8-like Glu-specific endopeptidase
MKTSITLGFSFLFSLSSAHAVLYKNDAQARVKASALERSGIAEFGGTISFISPTLGVTAKHVTPKGSVMMDKTHGIKIGKILDHSPTQGSIDYVIFEVSWFEKTDQKITPIECPSGTPLMNRISEITPLELPFEPTETFSVKENIRALGFPQDRKMAITSHGDQVVFVQSAEDERVFELLFNAGVVGGNSGGPIVDSTGALVGIVIGGSSGSMAPKFDPQNVEHFNDGLSAQALYVLSPTFKKVVDEAMLKPMASCL